MYITWTYLDDPKELPIDWCRARKVWKLKSRFKRLCNRSKGLTGTAWYEVDSHIGETLYKLAKLGVSPEEING
jgi:hypothetical protein